MASSKEILIAKFGTKCVVNGESIAQDRVNRHAARQARLLHDYRLGIVSSGSKGAGTRKIRSHRPDLIGKLDERTLTAVGSSSAYHTWRRAFGRLEHDGKPIVTAELKATHDDMDRPREGRSLVEVFMDCVNNGIVPVFNILDILDQSRDELGKIKEGKDNDFAASHFASNVGANTLMLLTARVKGVLIDGEVEPKISIGDLDEFASHFTGTDEDGTGSMISKVQAGAAALMGGVEQVFIGSSSSDPGQILSGAQGTQVVQ